MFSVSGVSGVFLLSCVSKVPSRLGRFDRIAVSIMPCRKDAGTVGVHNGAHSVTVLTQGQPSQRSLLTNNPTKSIKLVKPTEPTESEIRFLPIG